jgi:hypothetical protein
MNAPLVHPKLAEERRAALAKVAHHLMAAHYALQAAHAVNHLHQLGVELPAERLFVDAMQTCAHLAKAEAGNG